ncbi:MAG: hypothetical protein UR83_C0059G0003 [Candidatus Moranbacteria bacterium GW2011_GWF2_35_54]|nr:MAG: hypothetical protein UR83_C0059G0003 [Candidatus Moranbacteria bacterium GW2011_GWF2_35_54]
MIHKKGVTFVWKWYNIGRRVFVYETQRGGGDAS